MLWVHERARVQARVCRQEHACVHTLGHRSQQAGGQRPGQALPCAGCEVEGLERGRGRMLASSPVTNPALGTITGSSGLAAVNYGHLPTADTAGPCGRRHCLGSAPASASSGLPRDGQSWEPALHRGGAQPSQDGTRILCSALAAPLSHSGVERSPRVRLQNCPGAAHAPTGARRSPAAGRGQSAP